MPTLNIESSIECLKTIVDSLRCVVCDKFDGDRRRYSCGHIACGNCVETSGSCLLCLTPPDLPHKEPVVDQPLSRQIKNVAHLLDTFQALFHVDVYRHHRLSEQLKVEKELFPECIQAPSTYNNCNKKRYTSLLKDKSRKSVYPGEFIKGVGKMDSFNFVQDWLDKQDTNQVRKTRKPFSDLNVNDLRQNQVNKNRISTRADLILGKVKDDISNSETLKQNHFKTTKKRAAATKSSKASFKKLAQKENIQQFTKKNETLESGIEVDVDTILIQDSQSEIIDKDKLAWLAVIEADNKFKIKASTTNLNSTDFNITNESKNIKNTKVPFYKRTLLHELCSLCSQKQSNPKSKNKEAFKPVSISIENNTFRTTITVSNSTGEYNNVGRKSVSVQTGHEHMFNANLKTNGENHDREILLPKSQDLFISSPKQCLKEGHILANIHKEVVISDSDSSNGQMDTQMEVTAVVHRSCEDIDYGVLNEIEQSTHRRKRPRGFSPTSTNSSDKENYDPNRMKKTQGKKKRKF